MVDPDYQAEFEEAHKEACDRLEQEARRRAVEGVDEPVFYKGEHCGVVRKYSDTLLIFLLNGAMPHKYKSRFSGKVSGPSGPPVQVRARLEKLSMEDLLRLREILGRASAPAEDGMALDSAATGDVRLQIAGAVDPSGTPSDGAVGVGVVIPAGSAAGGADRRLTPR
jgi:hypothetical protein